MVYKGQFIRDTRQNRAMGHGTLSTATPKIKGQACSWHQRATRQYCFAKGHLGLKFMQSDLLNHVELVISVTLDLDQKLIKFFGTVYGKLEKK